jgi:hypothetical protein
MPRSGFVVFAGCGIISLASFESRNDSHMPHVRGPFGLFGGHLCAARLKASRARQRQDAPGIRLRQKKRAGV